ncbi:ABC nitrate/sulfonate/bicarbonate transporter, inner membrane subunit [Caballeronia hypogeia]|uniref:Thiamine pyrimidine synthase n=1 Tax=Caballeronia hypogeia TaxID=1777140 RepID=A0A158DHN7_9BURK|nr:ABC transporter substrate-binding protein [Caballeronia hypogeia]SAK93983.1 ABC nitrate/sulfonate/bicarbonate transporter, inner membrane subunit [Caballeronia hypogeia]
MFRNVVVCSILAASSLCLSLFPASSAHADEKVSVRLRWLPQAQFAGYYVALAKGFYKANGLDVTINPGGPNINVETLVSSGADTFGVGGGAEAQLFARDKGLPLVAIGMMLQQSPHVFVAKSDSGIKTLSDLKGKKVSTWFTGAQYTLYAMLASQKLEPTDAKVVPQAASMSPFIDGQIDVATATRYNELVTLNENGVKNLTVFKPSDFGVVSQADSIITSEKFLQAHRDQATAFLSATLQGWKYAFEHRDEAVDIVMASAPGANRAHQAAMLDQYATLAAAGKDGKGDIGEIDMGVAGQIQTRLATYKALQKPVDLSKAFDTKVWQGVPVSNKSL